MRILIRWLFFRARELWWKARKRCPVCGGEGIEGTLLQDGAVYNATRCGDCHANYNLHNLTIDFMETLRAEREAQERLDEPWRFI